MVRVPPINLYNIDFALDYILRHLLYQLKRKK